jgi:hypothetical protein
VADDSVQVEPATGAELPSPPGPLTSPAAKRVDPVLARYRADMRRSRTIYYAVVAVIVAAIGTWVGVAWSRGEISHASLHTVAPVPPPLRLATPSANPQQAWTTTDRIALGIPKWGGTIITYDQHTVGGRDARTGARTWTYTRTDRTVCTAAQLNGTVIAVYENKGNCDELSAFAAGSGQRRWTRTLDMDGMPLNGQPSYQVTPYTMLLASNSVIYAIDPASGYDRWTYERYGCTISHVVLGDAGALISQNCTSKHDCSGQKFCVLGPQLMLRNASDGRDDKSTTNPDKIIWNLAGNTEIPVSADSNLVSSVDSSGDTLHVYDSDKGTATGSIALSPATSALGPIMSVSTDTAEIVWIAGETYAIQRDATTASWHVDSAVPPVVTSTTNSITPSLANARISVPTSSGVALIDGNTGQVSQTFATATPGPGSRVYSVGTGFLIAGTTGIAAYR